MLTRRFKLSYVAPSGLALWVIPFYVGASPYAVLCRPFGACIVGDFLLRRGEPLRCVMSPLWGLHCGCFPFTSGRAPTLFYVAPSGLAFDKEFGSTRISLPWFLVMN